MHLSKAIFAWALASFTLIFASVSADAYDFEQFNIKNLTLPASYSGCTQEDCSSGFKAMLSQNGYTHEEWKEEVMVPQNLYVCARDRRGYMINVAIFDPTKEEDINKDLKFHEHMYDYNLYAEQAKAIELVLVDYRDSLVKAGINKRKIKQIKWFDKGAASNYTPYIRSLFEDESGLNVCEYTTVYDGNGISVSLSSKEEITVSQIELIHKMIQSIEHTGEIDYSHAKQVYRQNQRVKIPERLLDKQKKSSLLLGLALGFISIVIFTAIIITTNKIRRRNRSNRNSKSGNY